MAINMGWTQRASGRCYKSLTGQILGQGFADGRFVGVQLYNKNCVKCKFGKSHDGGLMCSGNYDGSSKGMEATGVEKVVLDFFEDGKTGSYIKKLVMDDNVSMKSKLVHPFGVAVELGHFKEWPTYENSSGKKVKKKSNGVLPTNHPKIEFLADKNHRMRCYGKHLWKLATGSKKSHR
jgi:hypothetical protein